MVDMSWDWLRGVASVGYSQYVRWLIPGWLFTMMLALYVSSLIMNNLRVKFFPMLRGGSALQFDNERMTVEFPTEQRLLDRRMNDGVVASTGKDFSFKPTSNNSGHSSAFDKLNNVVAEKDWDF